MTLRPLSSSSRARLERATARYQKQLDDAARAYLDQRGLGSSQSIETLRFGVVRSPLKEHEAYVGRLVIPYVGVNGNIYGIKFRCIQDHDHKAHGCEKYMGLPGQPTRMYNTRAILAPTSTLIVVEGELDAATLHICGWPAIGVPGSDAWRDHYPRVVAGFDHILIPIDGDDAGRKFGKAVAKSVSDARIIPLPPGEDVNSIYIRNGRDGLIQMLAEKDDDDE